jgi:hypothetical protein
MKAPIAVLLVAWLMFSQVAFAGESREKSRISVGLGFSNIETVTVNAVVSWFANQRHAPLKLKPEQVILTELSSVYERSLQFPTGSHEVPVLEISVDPGVTDDEHGPIWCLVKVGRDADHGVSAKVETCQPRD